MRINEDRLTAYRRIAHRELIEYIRECNPDQARRYLERRGVKTGDISGLIDILTSLLASK